MNTSHTGLIQMFVVGWMVGGLFCSTVMFLTTAFIYLHISKMQLSALTFGYFSVLFRNVLNYQSLAKF